MAEGGARSGSRRGRVGGLMAAVLAVGLAVGLGTSVSAATVSVAAVKTSVTTVAGCKTINATVTLNAVAPVGGATVSLQSTNPAATVPASVLVAAGTRSKTFSVKTVPVADVTSGAIAASSGGVTMTSALTVRPIGVAGVLLKPTSVAGGETAWGRARLECLAAPGTVTVTVASGDSAVVRPTVTAVRVPAGVKDGYFMISTTPTGAARSVGLTATTPGGPIRRATLGVTASAASGRGGYGTPARYGSFDHLNAYEVSGLEISIRNPGYAYVLHDGPKTEELWAVHLADGTMQRLPLSGFVGKDTEDLAVAPCSAGGPSCLYVGDIGDNYRKRTSVQVLRLPEPDLGSGSLAPLAYTSISLKYPDARRNAETLLVDDSGIPYTVSKDPGTNGVGAARLYGARSFTTSTMVDYGPVPVPLPALRWSGQPNMVTGGDSVDGRVILRTYDHAVEFRGAAGQGLSTFASWTPVEVPVARDPKGEAITYLDGECGYMTASELVGDLFTIPCQ